MLFGQDARLNSHYIMVVSGENGDTRPRLPVPDSYGLVIRRRDDPWVFSMKVDCPNVIKICVIHIQHKPLELRIVRPTPGESEQAFPLLVIPDFDLVIISSRAEYGLCRVETDTSYGSYVKAHQRSSQSKARTPTIMLVKSVYECAHLIIP